MEHKNHLLVQARVGLEKLNYPLGGIAAVMVLLLAGPFVSSLLPCVAFVICLYRVIKYDARVFVTDYCVLLSAAPLFCAPGGMSLLLILSLLAAVWHMFRGGIRADISYGLLVVLMMYLAARMQLELNKFVLCLGQLCVMCVLLPKQSSRAAARSALLFCVGLILTSVYALILRNTPEMIDLRGAEVPASEGSSFMRFQGLFTDPNYYMTLLITGLALLTKLWDSKQLDWKIFLAMGIVLTLFGILTYSKTFFLLFVVLGVAFIIWQFLNKQYVFGGILAGAALLAGSVLLFADFSPFAVVLDRLTSGNSLSDLTTGRSDVFAAYFGAITDNVIQCLFGKGLAASNLGKDPHNLYLEITYYTGFVGLLLLGVFYADMIRVAVKKVRRRPKQNFVAKYVVLAMVLAAYCALHGMYSIITYGEFFLVLLSILITKKKEAEAT